MIQTLSRASLMLFGLFGVSVLVSKSGFTILYSLVLIYGLFQFPWRDLAQRSWLEKYMMLLFPLAVLVNFFSVGGSIAAVDVLTRWTWPLIYFPIAHLHRNRNHRLIFFKGLAIGLAIACLYSYIRFYREFDLQYDGRIRVASFWDILRWAYFCATAVTLLFSILIKTNFLGKKIWKIIFILFVMTLVSLVLTSSRGAWVGALVGMFCALISQRKSLKYYLGYGILVCLLVMTSGGVRDRIFSIFKVERHGTQITSEDGSNAGRLHMWKVALDLYQEVPLFGVGFKNSKPALDEYLSRQSSDYVKTYTSVEYSYNDQHSSYMTLLLQFGGIYFLIIYGFFLVVTYRARREEIYIPSLICSFAVFFFYSAIASFEAVIIFSLISFLILNISCFQDSALDLIQTS